MYTIVKNVLNTGNYDLTVMLNKIDSLWVQGKLTDSERDELIQHANGGARAENSIDIFAKLEELDRRLVAVEKASTSDEETVEEYPAYESGKWYYTGDKVSFEGTNYICIAPEGTVCVWSPKDYPAYWE